MTDERALEVIERTKLVMSGSTSRENHGGLAWRVGTHARHALDAMQERFLSPMHSHHRSRCLLRLLPLLAAIRLIIAGSVVGSSPEDRHVCLSAEKLWALDELLELHGPPATRERVPVLPPQELPRPACDGHAALLLPPLPAGATRSDLIAAMQPVPPSALPSRPLGPTTCMTLSTLSSSAITHLPDEVRRLDTQMEVLGKHYGWATPAVLVAYSVLSRYPDLLIFYDAGNTHGELNTAASTAFPQHAETYGARHRRIDIHGPVVVQRHPRPRYVRHAAYLDQSSEDQAAADAADAMIRRRYGPHAAVAIAERKQALTLGIPYCYTGIVSEGDSRLIDMPPKVTAVELADTVAFFALHDAVKMARLRDAYFAMWHTCTTTLVPMSISGSWDAKEVVPGCLAQNVQPLRTAPGSCPESHSWGRARMEFEHADLLRCNSVCLQCGVSRAMVGKLRQCSGCGRAVYCSREHQVEHWQSHKAVCKQIAADKAANKSTQAADG